LSALLISFFAVQFWCELVLIKWAFNMWTVSSNLQK